MPCAYEVLKEARHGCGIPGAGATGGCETLGVDAGAVNC